MLKYKGYTGQYSYDDEAKVFFGNVIYLRRDVITFQADNIEELKQEFKNSIDDYLEWMHERGQKPEKPYTIDEISLQIPIKVYTELASAAQSVGIILDNYITETSESNEN